MNLTILTPKEIDDFPIKHYSPSAIRIFLIDQQQFCKQYIRREFQEEKGKSMLEGLLFHKVLEGFRGFFKEMKEKDGGISAEECSAIFDWDKSFTDALDFYESNGDVGKTDFGKTGSLEKSLKSTWQAIEFYKNELPEIQNVIAVETNDGRVAIQDSEGKDLPIPVKCKIDLVWSKDDGTVIIEDHKTCTSFEENEDGDFAGKYFIQAHMNWLVVKNQYGVEAESVIFRQVKKSKNSGKNEGKPQVVPYVQNITPETLKVYFEIYRRITLLLAGHSLFDKEKGIMRFLPNPYDFMAKEGWLDFVAEVLHDQPQVMKEIRKKRAEKFK